MSDQKRRLDKAKAHIAKKYGVNSVNLDGNHYRLNVVRSPSLMLDYKLGIGGFPYGHGVEIYGANRLGKSSAIGYGTLANVIKEGKVPALIASEPRLVTPDDRQWALKLGLDPDQCAIYYPNNVEEAFDVLRDLTYGNLVDYIMIDSLGGMGAASSAKEGGVKKAYGISGEVTDGLNAVMPALYKNNIGLMIINQQRQGVSPTPGMKFFESPGGEALHHHMRIRIHVKPGGNKYRAVVEGQPSLLVGQELTCLMRKNNMSQGQEKEAKFDFFHIETEQYGFGIDLAQDVINVGMISGVITKNGSHYLHESFPKGSLYGKPKVTEFLRSNPEAYEQIRQGVMEVMVKQELQFAKAKRDAELNAEVENVTDGDEGKQ